MTIPYPHDPQAARDAARVQVLEDALRWIAEHPDATVAEIREMLDEQRETWSTIRSQYLTKEIAARRLAANHGAVYREIVEYNEPGQRIVICELRDGWHVVEVYLTSGDTTQRDVIRKVVETLAEARAWARGPARVIRGAAE